MKKKREDQKNIVIRDHGIAVACFSGGTGQGGGGFVADLLPPYERIDPDKAFAWVSVHHITEMLIVLAVMIILSKLLKVDFGFNLGDRKKEQNMW